MGTHCEMRKHEIAVCETACTVVWKVGGHESRRYTPVISVYLLLDILYQSYYSCSCFMAVLTVFQTAWQRYINFLNIPNKISLQFEPYGKKQLINILDFVDLL